MFWLILLFRSFGSFLVFDLIEVRDRAGADDLHDDGRPAGERAGADFPSVDVLGAALAHAHQARGGGL